MKMCNLPYEHYLLLVLHSFNFARCKHASFSLVEERDASCMLLDVAVSSRYDFSPGELFTLVRESRSVLNMIS